MASTAENDKLHRSSSQLSTASRRSGINRAGSRRQSAIKNNDTAKTLESFPSLSPEASPSAKRAQPPTSQPEHTSSQATITPTKQAASAIQNLTQRTQSSQNRSALFDEANKDDTDVVPGALHHATDEHIKRLVKKAGAIPLVRQLASDLAQRDAELTGLRRRADERERELKRMLREVEVSNMDIEKRLRRLDNPQEIVDAKSHNKSGPAQKPAGTGANGRIKSVSGGIDAMVGQAMTDEVNAIEIDDGYLDAVASDDRAATVKAKHGPHKGSDGNSVASSIDSQGKHQGTVRGWKDYLWGSTVTSHKTSKASSIVSEPEEDQDSANKTRGFGANTARRKGLNGDTFQPPSRAVTDENNTPGPKSRKTSNATSTSWTVNLFGGKRNGDAQTPVRDRSNTTGHDQFKSSRSGSTQSGPPPRSAKAALMRVSSMESSRLHAKRSATPLSVTPKAGGGKNAIPPVPPLPSPKKANAAANLGPVELDTIHPPDSKPPTLIQNDDKYADDLLTDRFGFIYDQRRRRKEAETAISHKRAKSSVSTNLEMIQSTRASMKSPGPDHVSLVSANQSPRPDSPTSNEELSEQQPKKRWQDYLKVATVPTELLLHTPSPKPGINVISADVTSPVKALPNNDSRPSIPPMSSNAEPEISPVTAGKAVMAKTSTTKSISESAPAVAEEEPVKLLLGQLTELHDTLQREKTVKWNDFLRKVRAERRKEGEIAAANNTEGGAQKVAMPEMMLTDGEVIGVSGLGNKGKVGRAKWKEFKQLVLGGIPVSYRAKIWAECSGAAALRVPGYYDDLIRTGTDDPTVVSQIQMDIHRTLTDNVFFRKGPGVAKLNEVLIAYSRRNPEVGYCQGMNLIAASLLLIMPTAEDAFWVLTSLIENILPQHYYDPTLLASRADQTVLRSYVSELLPRLSAHLDSLGIELDALTFQWFLSVFTDCLSAEALFRVWDVIFCFNDGSTFLFQIALALLKLNEQKLLECDSAARVYGYIGNEMTDHAISIDGLISAGDALGKVVRREEVEGRRWEAVERERGKEKKGQGSESGSGELSLQEPRPVE